MSHYDPLLKTVWQNELSNQDYCQNWLKNKSFLCEKSLLAWQEIEQYSRDDAFFMDILDNYKDNYTVFLQIITGEELEFSRLLATFWENLISHKWIRQQLEKRKTTLIKNVIYYKYNNNACRETEPLLAKIIAYLYNPSYEMPIFVNSIEQKLDHHFLPTQFDILGDSFGRKCKTVADNLLIQAKNPNNNSYLLANLFFADSIKKIWATAELDVLQQAETVAEAQAAYQSPRQDNKYPLNQILYGVAGTGKTYQARQIAQYIVSEKRENIVFTTFHAGYYYEDFIEGIKPKVSKQGLIYELQDGIFKQIAAKAAADPVHNYVLIIDEINRANLAQVFGELLSLIEANKRAGQKEALKAKLPYSKTEFEVPANLYLIGTMNSSDKSITAIDWALRRRFYFKSIRPEPNLLAEKQPENIDLCQLLTVINERIALHIGSEAEIGHAYFMNIDTLADLNETMQQQIIPLLIELLLGETERLKDILTAEFVQELSYPEWERSRWIVRHFDNYFPTVVAYQRIYAHD